MVFRDITYNMVNIADPRAGQVKWWIQRELLFRIALVLYPIHQNIYHILWITDCLPYFDMFSEYRKF
jgi:hypothetical protein